MIVRELPEETVRPLIETLSKTAGLPTFQLTGHIPHLAFWMAEVRHAVDDGYSNRYADTVAAQTQYDIEYLPVLKVAADRN